MMKRSVFGLFASVVLCLLVFSSCASFENYEPGAQYVRKVNDGYDRNATTGASSQKFLYATEENPSYDPDAARSASNDPYVYTAGENNRVFAARYGPEIRLSSKLGVFFDTGKDDKNELDIFKDGALTPTFVFVGYSYLRGFGPLQRYIDPTPEKKIRWGFPVVGLGLSSPANDSPDNTDDSSGEPVIMGSLGIELDFADLPFPWITDSAEKLNDNKPSISLECSYAIGWSGDEGLDDADDSAVYVGFTMNYPIW